MPIPKTSEEAIAQRLLTEPTLTRLVGNRITPNIPEQEPEGDYLVFRLVLGGGGTLLDGRPGLQNYFYRLDAFAASDERAREIMEAAVNRLCGNRKLALSPYRDLTHGVQGCFPAPDLDADTEDAVKTSSGQTVSIWFCPQ